MNGISLLGVFVRRALGGVLFSGLSLLLSSCGLEKPIVEWVMVAVSQEPNATADAHFLSFANGFRALIDTGTRRQAAASLLPFLKQRGVSEIDHLHITHAHANHYGGIHALLDAGVRIKSASVGLPQEKACRDEGYCNWDDFSKTLERLRAAGTLVTAARAGQ